ncbi:hypothetical protein LOTGIDRAFT_230220 [Lottia gigantea]|uniref:ADP-ribosylation factor-binding protein GGA1 n=1 Tax=Lottia gigantea TaxID=225164 RepID=V4AIL4_LOTGI|nr:hypothetical protein LOTGIDRAFT_230220 [Lottia gigantea]ESP03919.1 hypothetical protein LOTGIDRAFT_230220 [Lottia gigantea]
MADQEETLENYLNRATNPANRELDPEHVAAFCDLVNKHLEGPQISVRLLAHKIQSPQEKEAEYALITLEECVKNCGQYFHQEIGKFRFLNEIIKVISPKYLGNRTSEKIKKKCIEILYSWKIGLPHETKIAEAYSMLKAQGIVKVDPTLVDKHVTFPAPTQRRADFEDEEKAKVLNRLLKSKNPEDLQAANRLIKNMVKDDVVRSEKKYKRINELETINNNVQLLQEMIASYNSASSTASDKDMMKEIYESLEKLRPNLFRLASDTDEKDNDGINDILQANDNVMKVMSLYKTQIEGVKDDRGLATDSTPASTSVATPLSNTNSSALNELGDIFNSMSSQQTSQTIPQSAPVNSSQSLFNTNPTLAMGMFSSLNQQQQQPSMMPAQPNQLQQLHLLQQQHLQQQRMAFGASGPNPAMASPQLTPPISAGGTSPALQPQKPIGTPATAKLGTTTQPSKPLSDLDVLGQSLLQQNLGGKEQHKPVQKSVPLSLNELASLPKPSPVLTTHSSPQTSLLDLSNPVPLPTVASPAPVTTNGLLNSPSKTTEILPLTDITVPLESVKPGDHQPVSVLDKNNVKILLHIGKDRPRPDVTVMVVSTISTSPHQITNFVFQAAVPKIMKVKLQPPSANTLPAYNPILPPTAITQVMLLANPRKEKVRLKFKVMYSMNDENVTEMGEVDSIPVQ